MGVLSVGLGRDAPFLSPFLRNEMHGFLTSRFLNARDQLYNPNPSKLKTASGGLTPGRVAPLLARGWNGDSGADQ